MPFSIFSCSMLTVVQFSAANVISHSCNSCCRHSALFAWTLFHLCDCWPAQPFPGLRPLSRLSLWVWSRRHHLPPQLLCLCGQTHLLFFSQSACFPGTMLMFLVMLSPYLDFSSSGLYWLVHSGSSLNSNTTLDVTSFMHSSCWEIQRSVHGLNVFTAHLKLHWPPDLTCAQDSSGKLPAIVSVTAPSTCIHTAEWKWTLSEWWNFGATEQVRNQSHDGIHMAAHEF